MLHTIHQNGVPVEIIDTLQGRTPANMFAKWYCCRRPSLDYEDKTLSILDRMFKQELGRL